MAVTVDRVIVELEVRDAQLRASVARAEAQFDRSMRKIAGSAAATEVRVASAFRNIAASAGLLVGTAGVAAAARGFLQLADTAKQLEAKLRLATRESGSFAQAQEDVRRIAAETRSGIEETASLYAVFQRNSRELGISQEQAARATQSLGQAFLISGASAAEAADVTRQFIQGIQNGTLRGDEFNSIMERGSRLQRLIADAMGVSTGQLRALAEQGRITADVLLRALTERRFTDQLDAEFRTLPVTFEQAMTAIHNAAIITFGAFDRGGQFSTWLANFAQEGSETFTSLEGDAQTAGATIRSVFDGLANVFDPMAENAANVFSFITNLAESAATDIAALSRAWADISHNWPTFGVGQTAAMRRGIMPRLPGFVEGSEGFTRPQQQSLNARTNDAGLSRSRSIEALIRAGQRSTPAPAPSGGSRPRRGGGGRRGPDPEAQARRAAEEQERIEAQIRDAQGAYLEELARSAVTAAERSTLERQALDHQAESNRLAIAADEKLNEAQRAELLRLHDLMLGLERATIAREEEVRLAEQQLDLTLSAIREQQSMEQALLGLAVTADERRAIELRLLDLAYQEERARLAAIEANEALEPLIRERARLERQALEQRHGVEREGVLRRTAGPGEAFLQQLRDDAIGANEALEQIAVDGLQSVTDGLADAITGARSLGDVFKQVANQIISDLIRIAIQQAIIKPIASALFGGAPVGGFATGGSFIVGGRPGVDQNLLSLNGSPVARVGRGERVTVTPQGGSPSFAGGAVAGRGSKVTVLQTIQVDARGAVMNDKFAALILSRANQDAIRISAKMGEGVLKAVPHRLASFQRNGT